MLCLENIVECDNCVHLLLDDIEELDSNVTIIRKDLNTISVGAWALVRLQKINETVYQLRVCIYISVLEKVIRTWNLKT